MEKFEYLTLERASRGATYRSKPDSVTVYGIGTWGSNSVLEGQQKRCWLDVFEEGTYEENLDKAKEYCAQKYSGTEVHDLEYGSSYREPYLGHLPDDGDGDWW